MKTFLSSIFLFTFLFSQSTIFAQNSTSSGRIQRREEIQDRIQTRQENIEAAREQFRTRLENLKDAKKQKIIENLDKSYVNINARWTTHFKNALDRLSKIADKLNASSEIKNQISAVQAAVDTQAAKTYTLDLTDETKLGEAARAVHQQLRSDLETLRDQIQNIRESLRNYGD